MQSWACVCCDCAGVGISAVLKAGLTQLLLGCWLWSRLVQSRGKSGMRAKVGSWVCTRRWNGWWFPFPCPFWSPAVSLLTQVVNPQNYPLLWHFCAEKDWSLCSDNKMGRSDLSPYSSGSDSAALCKAFNTVVLNPRPLSYMNVLSNCEAELLEMKAWLSHHSWARRVTLCNLSPDWSQVFGSVKTGSNICPSLNAKPKSS